MAPTLTARIDKAGTQLAYIDSGPLPNETYTTLVIAHGFLYTSQTFRKLIPIAQSHNIRIIAFNRRDYVGSTEFSPRELAELTTSDETRSAFLQARGLEIARFLVWVIKELNIPTASVNGREGGLAVMGWSLGNITTMAFLGNLKTYPSEVIEVLEPYLKTFFIYESDYLCLGYPDPEGGYLFYDDESIPPHLFAQLFGIWVSSYYKHPCYTSQEQEQGRENQERFLDCLHLRIPQADETLRPNTHETLSAEELATIINPVSAMRSEGLFSLVKRSALHEQMERVLLVDSEPKTGDTQPCRSSRHQGFLCVLHRVVLEGYLVCLAV